MIDIRFARENPDAVRESQRRRGNDEASVDALLAADEARRSALQAFETARASQKELSRSIGKASPEERPAVLAEAKALAERVKELEAAANEAEQEYLQANAAIQNIVLDGVPAGGEEDYEVLKHVGEPRAFDFEPKDHLDVAEALDAIDMARGTKVSGSRFYFLKEQVARLEQALMWMALDLATANGFTMMTTPTLVRPEIMNGTGFNVKHDDEIYRLERDDLYLVGTSEVALAGYHMDEILNLSDGPKKYLGWSSCYRREAGAAGKDTRGIIRVHQFNKAEMFVYCQVEQAEEIHEQMRALEEEMLQKCGLAYRVIDTAAGDLGTSAARKFDCEAWVPTQGTYRELTSTSNCTTYQARRLNIRERTADTVDDAGNVRKGRTRAVATLNGTLATTRWVVAILETHQQPDGSVRIPEALRPYMGGVEVIPVVS